MDLGIWGGAEMVRLHDIRCFDASKYGYIDLMRQEVETKKQIYSKSGEKSSFLCSTVGRRGMISRNG